MTRHITPIARPAPLLEPAPPLAVQRTRLLTCDTCKADTPHALTRSQSHYVCGLCGTEIEYHINAGPKMWAIR